MKPDFNLNDLPKKNIYKVPEAYFDKLPNRIMQRVTTPSDAKWHWLPAIPAPLRLALASLLLLLAFVGVFYLSNQTGTKTNGNYLAAATEQEILDYLLTYERLETADLTELTASNQDMTHFFIQASDTEIEASLETRDIEEFYL